MPVVKLASTHNARKLANYLQRDDKGQDRAVFVSENDRGKIERVNSAQHAEKDFQEVRERFEKTNGVQAHMAYISFKRDDLGDLARADGKPDWEKIEQFGHEYARRAGIAERHQYYIVAHDDKANPHLHLVWNAVSDKDGKKYEQSNDVARQRDISDELSREHGIQHLPERDKNPEKVPDAVIRGVQHGQPEYSWKRDLQYRIKEAAAKSESWEDFKQELRELNVQVRERGSGVSYSFKDDSGAHRVARGSRLGEAYTREDIERRFALHERLMQAPGLAGAQRFGAEIEYEMEHFTSWKQEMRTAFREAERRAHSPEEFYKLAQERGLTIKKVPQPIRTETRPTPKTLEDIREEVFKQELRQRELETGRAPTREEAQALASQMTGITPERAEALYSAEHEAARRADAHEGPGSRQEDNRSHEAERPLQAEPKTLQEIKEEIFKQELRQRELETGHRQTPAEASALAAETHDIMTKRAYELYDEYLRESRANANGNPDPQQERPEAQHQEGSPDEAQSRPKTFQETEEQFFRDELRQRELETGHVQSLREARALASQMTDITPERAYNLYDEYIRESRAKATTPETLQDIREQIFKDELRQQQIGTGRTPTREEAQALASQMTGITPERAEALYSAEYEARRGQGHAAEQYHYELHYQDRYGVEHVATPEVLRNGMTDRDLEMRIARTRDNPIQERAQSATPTLAIGAATRSIESISQAITREVDRNSNPTGGIPDYGPVRERVRRHAPDDDGLRSRQGFDSGGW